MKKTEESESGIKRLIISALLGALVCIFTAILLILVISAFVSSGKLSLETADKVLFVALFVGGAAGGLISVKRTGRKNLIAAAAEGIMAFLMLCFAGIVFWTEFIPEEGGLIFISIFLGSLFSAFVPVGKKHRRKK